VFKGGVSLEKMRIIQRFSEDLDLVVVGEYATPNSAKRALKAMARAAVDSLPNCAPKEEVSGGVPGAIHRSAYLPIRIVSPRRGEETAVADPDGIVIEMRQSGGPNPADSLPVTSLLARALADAGVNIADYLDLAPFDVKMLHPGRTLIEKLLRMNNFALDESRRGGVQGWPRIGRQYYDVWALLGDERVLQFMADKAQVAAIVDDCIKVAAAGAGDLPVPSGGFAACELFDTAWPESHRMRKEHDAAMQDLYYGPAGTAPSFGDVLDRVAAHRDLLDFQTSAE
jgi:hypothetical protein